MKTILVTGGAGFIGANLCRKLLKDNKDNRIICIDNLSSGKISNISELLSLSNFTFHKIDVKSSLIKFLSKDDIHEIYHLACIASPSQYKKNPVDTLLTNINGTYNVLELSHFTGAKILFASTSEVYGDPLEHPQKESYLGNVNSLSDRACYDNGKRAAETLCYDFKRQYGINIRIARIFNTYGPFMQHKDGRVVTNFIKQSLNGKPFTIYGNGSQTRSLCYVDDTVDGLIKLMKSKYDETPINIGNPEEITILDLCREIHDLIHPNESQISYTFYELPQADPKKRCPDITLAKKKLRWEPKVSRKDGLLRTIEYISKELKHEKKKNKY